MKHPVGIVATLLFTLVVIPVGSAAQTAPAKKAEPAKAAEDEHRKEDIARHRQMARAHDEAARCMEGGEKESVCMSKLQQACKGIAVGKYCGMRHGH